jgi:glutathione S-transferase
MLDAVRHGSAVLSSTLSSTFEGWRGTFVVYAATQPEKPLTLYDFEACPFCRRVREALTALHLDVDIRPCPRNGQRFRTEALRIGGKAQFPLLVDANVDMVLYESETIVEHLFRQYGPGDVVAAYRARPLAPVTRALAFATRLGRGLSARPSHAPREPLRLWSFEASPFSRLVRERLSELELPYTLHNLGKEHWKESGPATRRITPNPYVPRAGGKRHAFWRAHGRVQLPYLEDPNSGAALFESARIIAYLEQTYAV